jgi:HEAT repeat protein
MDVRWVAATRLAQLAPNPKQVQRVVPLLLEWLEGREWLLQNGAATALGDLNPDDSRVVPALVKALAQEDKRVNINAAAALLSLAKEPEESIPALIRFVNRHKGNPEYSNQRCGIASTMWRFSQKTKSIVPLLIEIAADESESEGVRIGAMDSLARIGPAAQEAIAPLKNLLKATLDTKGDFATAIRRALEGIERRE